MNLAQRGKKPKKLILNEKIDNFMIADFGESTKQKLVSQRNKKKDEPIRTYHMRKSRNCDAIPYNLFKAA